MIKGGDGPNRVRLEKFFKNTKLEGGSLLGTKDESMLLK